VYVYNYGNTTTTASNYYSSTGSLAFKKVGVTLTRAVGGTWTLMLPDSECLGGSCPTSNNVRMYMASPDDTTVIYYD